MRKRKNLFASLAVFFLMAVFTAFPALAGGTLVWPVPASHTLSQGLHGGNAIDISAATGSTILAAKGGTVTKITYCTQTHHNYGDCNGFGTGLVILGDDGRAYQYAHMQAGGIPSNVRYGARVEAGQQIGKVGMTGFAYGPHLHFGISNTKNYWEAGSDPSKETYIDGPVGGNISVGNQSASNISNTNAKLFGTLYKTAGTNCSTCGIYLGTSSSSMTKRNAENVGSASNNYRNGTGFDIWYDLNTELGISLTPGTTYYYRIYAVVNGKEYTGPVSSFKTTGTAPAAVSISVGNQSASNISDRNAKLFGTLYKAAGYNCSTCGIYLGTSSYSMTKRNTENVGAAANNYRNGASFDIWYDLNTELGIYLTPGTIYYYRIYAVVNGKEYTGPVSSFKTTGTSSSGDASVIQARVSDSSGYTTPSSESGGSSASGSGTASAVDSTAPATDSTASAADSTASVQESSSSAAKTTVKKKAQKLKVTPGKKTLKAKILKKRSVSFRLKITGRKGKLTIKSNSKYIKISGTKVTVRKGTKRGTYKIKVRAAGNSKYKAAVKTIKIIVK